MKQPPKKPVLESESDSADAQPIEVEALSGGAAVVAADVIAPLLLSSDDARRLTDAEIEELRKVLRMETRRRDSEREESRPRAGSKVRILRGRPKYVGKIGTAVIVRRSRCFVSVPDLTSPAYVLVTDLELLER